MHIQIQTGVAYRFDAAMDVLLPIREAQHPHQPADTGITPRPDRARHRARHHAASVR